MGTRRNQAQPGLSGRPAPLTTAQRRAEDPRLSLNRAPGATSRRGVGRPQVQLASLVSAVQLVSARRAPTVPLDVSSPHGRKACAKVGAEVVSVGTTQQTATRQAEEMSPEEHLSGPLTPRNECTGCITQQGDHKAPPSGASRDF